jgi:endonuclease YncB( thermonuclease family)
MAEPYVYVVNEVTRVVDGDTVDCRIALGFGLEATFRFRVAGIDTPETYGPRPSPRGAQASAFTADWLAARQGQVLVRTSKGNPSTAGIGDGAFGRWLGTFLGPNGESLADALRSAGHAKATP